MKPIQFTCAALLPLAPGEIAAQILNLARWSEFRGYLVLPGIRGAEFEVRTPEVVGSRVRVTNTDGSRHLAEIVEWDPGRRIRVRLYEFSPPLARLANEFEETWEFEPIDNQTEVTQARVTQTKVTRTLVLYPKSAAARPLLWLISILLKRAIARHLRQMQSGRKG